MRGQAAGATVAAGGLGLVVCGLVEPHLELLAWLGLGAAVAGLAGVVYSTRMLRHQTSEAKRTLASRLGDLSGDNRLATVGALAAGLLHDMRNVVGALHTNIERLQRKRPDDPALADALLASSRLVELSTALPSYGRPPKPGESKLEALDGIIDEVLRLARYMTVRGPAVHVESTTTKVVAHGPGQLHQVLLNLVRNGIQATQDRPDGAVWISAQALSSERVRIIVEDNGGGLGPNSVEALFEPFGARRRGWSGTGLGLFISRAIVNSAGGTLTGGNGARGGARFCIDLPVAAEHDAIQHRPIGPRAY